MDDQLIETGLESSGLKPDPVPFDLNQLLKKLYNDFNPFALERECALAFVAGLPDYACRINLDSIKLHKVLNNLIENAIHLNQAKKVEYGYSLKDSILEFYVKDDGKGVDEDAKKSLFYNPDAVKAGNEGTPDPPLPSLLEVKENIEQLGGKIWVTSQVKGSSYLFNIPFIPLITASKPKTETRDQAIDFSKFTILVAEDDEINFVFLERLLSKTDARIIRAANGLEAVNHCRDIQPIHLVLMDINMPFMNGLDATRIIKSEFPVLPVIAVTAYTIRGDRETCLNAGCIDYIPKPIKREELFEKLGKYLQPE